MAKQFNEQLINSRDTTLTRSNSILQGNEYDTKRINIIDKGGNK